jgi:hypothetical protein
MIGWYHAATDAPAPADAVEVAHLDFQGVQIDDVEAWWIHPASGMSYGCSGATLLRHVARGISVQIAEAVATEMIGEAPVPEDPAQLSEIADAYTPDHGAQWDTDGGTPSPATTHTDNGDEGGIESPGDSGVTP